MAGTDPLTGKRHNTRRLRIGDTTTHSIAEAREVARDFRRKVQQGVDPKLEKAEAVAAAEAERRAVAATKAARVSCGDRLGLYQEILNTRGRSPRYQQDELRHVHLGLASAQALELAPGEITASVIEKILTGCPTESRSARFSALHRFLTWAGKGTGVVPVTLLFDRHERPRPPAARQRVLSGADIAAIWHATRRLPNAVITDLVQLTISIPCRRGEAATARWADFDLAARIWHQPTSKNGDPHDFPLNDRALAVLGRRRAESGHPENFVFPGPRYSKPFSGWSNLIGAIATRIDPKTPVARGWRLHDFRRSFVTILAEQGHDETLLDLTIDHHARDQGPVYTVSISARCVGQSVWSRWRHGTPSLMLNSEKI